MKKNVEVLIGIGMLAVACIALIPSVFQWLQSLKNTEESKIIRSKEYFVKGYRMIIKEGNYEAAIVEFDKSIALYDSNGLYFAHRANANRHTGNNANALSDYNKAITSGVGEFF